MSNLGGKSSKLQAIIVLSKTIDFRKCALQKLQSKWFYSIVIVPVIPASSNFSEFKSRKSQSEPEFRALSNASKFRHINTKQNNL